MLEQVEDFKPLDDDLDGPFRMPLEDVNRAFALMERQDGIRTVLQLA